jgi:hypothetical protein
MFINVGRFRFRPMAPEERGSLMQRMDQDVPPLARDCKGFRGVYFVPLSDEELMTVWLFDSEPDWNAALERFGPLLQEYVVPNLAGPPDRVGGEAAMEVTP